MTALLHAAREGHIGVAMALLDGGADVNQVSAADATSPLLVAALNGRFDLMLPLLERGADPTLGTFTDGVTPLFAVLQTRWPTVSGYPNRVAHLQQETQHLDALAAEGVALDQIRRLPDRQIGLCFHECLAGVTSLIFYRRDSAATTMTRG